MEAKTNDNNRIFCVDPNDMYGHVDGQPVTPDYTDMCIWCNLVVETVPRVKNQVGGVDKTGTYAIQSDMTYNGKNTYVSFFQGYDAQKYNYLTTDYTEIDFSTVKKRNMIEGLQVESIRVGFANFMCPTVTIKFVDIRGGGFFAREEATHNEYGQLGGLESNGDAPIDNVFGCFMTFPYPRFKLQIKGFYGNAVTYHLTCSKFTGNLNASNGNFELTATFIGYEYGVLGDIPFSYIVAAPYTRIGAKYWNEHVDSDAWKLSYTIQSEGGNVEMSEAPVKLIDFYNSIEAAINEFDGSGTDLNEIISDASSTVVMDSYLEHKSSLTDLQNSINRLKNELRRLAGDENVVEAVGDGTDMMVLFSKKGDSLKITDGIVKLRNEICDMVERHVYRYEGSEDSVDNYVVPNCDSDGSWGEWAMDKNMDFTQYIRFGGSDIANPNILVADASADGNEKRIEDDSSCVDSKIRMLGSDSKTTVTPVLAEKLFRALGSDRSGHGDKRKAWSITEKGGEYKAFAAVVDFGNATEKIAESLTNVEIEIKKFKEKESQYKPIGEMLGFSPYIANYFKVVMCHLETFVHMFWHTADAIYEKKKGNRRAPYKMGIRDLQIESDIPSAKYDWVPPFPAVYKKFQTEDEVDRLLLNGGNIQETSWVGDFRGETPWDEEEFVVQMTEALRLAMDRSGVNGKVRKVSSRGARNFNASYNPIDYLSEFPMYALDDKQSMAYYTAVRAMLLFGVMDTSEQDDEGHICEMAGALDAYNYISNCDSPQRVREFVGEGEGDTLPREIMDIVTCKDTGDGARYAYAFEFTETVGNRHPVLREIGDDYKYVYMRSHGNDTPIVPVENKDTLDSVLFSDRYEWSGGRFSVKETATDGYVFGDSCEGFLHDSNRDNERESYTNSSMFAIITDSNTVDSIIKSSETLKSQKRIGNYNGEDAVKVDDRYTLGLDNAEKYCGESEKAAYGKSYSDYGIDGTMLYGQVVSGTKYTSASETNEFINKFTKAVLT